MPKKKKKQSGKGVYDFIANNAFGANLGKGEIHAPQYTAQGFRFGNYIGPNTDIYNNIRNGRTPVSDTDRVAQAHDLRYGKAKTVADVRAADLKMVSKLKEIQKSKSDYRFNTYMGMLPIRAKMLLEDIGIMRQGSFADFKGVAIADQKTSNDKLKELTQIGYGKKNTWMLHVAACRKKHPSKSYKECLKLASKTYKK
jgi:hypothetical protein